MIYLLLFRVVPLTEDFFNKTIAQPPSSAPAGVSRSSAAAGAGAITGVNGKSNNNSSAGGKWPLMTRAHLAQAVVCIALTEKADDSTVSLCSLFSVLLPYYDTF